MKTPYRILKLRSGEDIITRIKGKNKEKYIVERPMQMKITSVLDPDSNKIVRKDFLLLRNWLQYTNHIETEIPIDWVAVILTPDAETSISYEQAKENEDCDLEPTENNIPTKEHTEFMNNSTRKDIDPNNIMVTLAIPPMIFISLLSQGLFHAGHFGMGDIEDDEDQGPGNNPTDWSPNIEDYFDDED